MMQFSVEIYEMMAEMISENQKPKSCFEAGNGDEQVFEMDWEGTEILLRFTFYYKNERCAIACVRADTFRDGVLLDNDFEAEELRKMI